MKTTKRVFALVLVAMMLAMMIPFAASAANNSLTLSMSKDGFEYAVYQVATINTETGVYTINTNDTNVTTAMKTKNQSGKDFLAALDAASDPGTFVGTVKKGTNYTTSTLGIYYARVSAWPDEGWKTQDLNYRVGETGHINIFTGRTYNGESKSYLEVDIHKLTGSEMIWYHTDSNEEIARFKREK